MAEVPAPATGSVAGAVSAVREATPLSPDVAVVLGSGLDGAIADLTDEIAFGYDRLPGCPVPTAVGHRGRLRLGKRGELVVALFEGRHHFYESGSMAASSFTVRLARSLGARTAVLTASVGALVEDLAPGDLVVLDDHLGLMGANPLAGWRYPDGSPAFVDVAGVYDAALVEVAERAAAELGIATRRGVYAAVSGPAYETPAEAEFLRRAGATVVGMSIVPESVAAHALGMRVLSLCTVANRAGAPVDHAEVLAAGKRSVADVGRLLEAILPQLTRSE